MDKELIKRISTDTVHRLCSSQVILNLAIAVKELIENALDAGATNIRIKLKEFGYDSIEVSDDGTGVAEPNFEGLGLKHYTSKISSFADLDGIQTLGFRGEALSSLCAVANVTIITRHISADVATKLNFDTNGTIAQKSMCAGEQGTTVILEKLFHSLPVRRKEYFKNLKREFSKMCQILHGYSLISTNVRFSCVNILANGKTHSVFNNTAHDNVRGNIADIFGAKQISTLISVDPVIPSSDDLQEFGWPNGDHELVAIPFSFELLISSVMHGAGRASADRQFVYVNNRPCEYARMVKLINAVYKSYNGSQFPFLFLNVIFGKGLVDVNVTPDKRQIFVHKEKLLLATIKSSLNEAFKQFPSTYKLTEMDIKSQGNNSQNVLSQHSISHLKRNAAFESSQSMLDESSFLDRFRKRAKTENVDAHFKTASSRSKSSKEGMAKMKSIASNSSISSFLSSGSIEHRLKDVPTLEIPSNMIINDDAQDISVNKNSSCVEEVCSSSEMIESVPNSFVQHVTQVKEADSNYGHNSNETQSSSNLDMSMHSTTEVAPLPAVLSCTENTISRESTQELAAVPSLVIKRQNSLKIVLDDILDEALLREKGEIESIIINSQQPVFLEGITSDANAAESELERIITKTDFKRMEIIGQFNLGFIITRLDKDLFIIDQHACDEKYNFEQLQHHAEMKRQPLINGKLLHLTAVQENLLLDNEALFNRNGFQFSKKLNDDGHRQIFLTAVPMCKNLVFGLDDIDDMLFQLEELPQETCRPSRLRAMFASKACRKSVMIGKALSKSEMRTLVDHMGEIEHPWNCPHGRPTMRHIADLTAYQHHVEK